MRLSDEDIRAFIIDAKIKVYYKDVDVLRELAKVPKIRMDWAVARASKEPMFKGSVSEWSAMQKRLVYWLSFYTNVESAYERPPDRVIYKDNLLDKWLEKQADKAERECEQKWLKGPSTSISKTAGDQDEVYES